jgi:hypothetical protein
VLWRFSFCIRFARCVSTVDNPALSGVATSLFERPSASRERPDDVGLVGVHAQDDDARRPIELLGRAATSIPLSLGIPMSRTRSSLPQLLAKDGLPARDFGPLRGKVR